MKRNITNKELKYQGWQQIKGMLDDEMPTKRNKRTVLLYLLFLGLLTFGIFSLVLNNQVKSNIQNAKIKVIDNNLNFSKNKNTKASSSLKSAKSNAKFINHDSIANKPKQNRKEKISRSELPIPKSFALSNIDRINSNQDLKNNKKDNNNQINSNSDILNKITFEKNTESIKILNNKTLDLKAKQLVFKNNYSVSSNDRNLLVINNIKSNHLNKLSYSKTKVPLYNLKINPIKHSNLSKFLNPYFETKLHIFSYNNINPKFSIELGNRFNINHKFFIDVAAEYTQVENVIPGINIVNERTSSNYSIRKTTELYYVFAKSNSVFSGVFQLSIHEGFTFLNKLNLRVGLGVALTKKLKNQLYKGEINYIKNNGEKPGFSELINQDLESIETIKKVTINNSIIYTNLDLSYRVHNHISLKIGYKYYFNNSYQINITENKTTIGKIKPIPYSTRLYLGARYSF